MFRFQSVEQAQVEGEFDWWRDLELREIRVSRIYEKIKVGGHDGTWNGKNRRDSIGNPLVS